MYKHIMIATDGSSLSLKGVEHGVALAKATGAKVLLVTVSEPWTSSISGEMAISFPVKDYDDQVSANATRILAAAAEVAAGAGVASEQLHVKEKLPAEGIVETAKARGCDLIVMASHGRRGLSRMLLGSQANKVATYSDMPVLICR